MIDLDEKSRKIIEIILAPYIDKGALWVFGSRVEGKAVEHSDLDLVIRDDEPLPFSDYLKMKDALEYSKLSMRVDLLDWQRISPEFRESIGMHCEPWH